MVADYGRPLSGNIDLDGGSDQIIKPERSRDIYSRETIR